MASGAFAIVIVGAALPIKISIIVISTVTVPMLLTIVVFAIIAAVVVVVGLVMIAGMLIVVGLLIVAADIDITLGITNVGLLITGEETGIMTDGIDTIVAIEGATADNGSTTGTVIAAPLEPDPWIGNAPGELNGLFWAKAVPTKPPKDAERRYSSFVMLKMLYAVKLLGIVTRRKCRRQLIQ